MHWRFPVYLPIIMQAIILAAGRGTRMGPLTDATPKPLLTVRGKPLLYHLVASLPRKIDELIIVVGYLGDQIREYCGARFHGRPVTYVTQEEHRGTYHALELARTHIGHAPFALFFGDDIFDLATIRKLIEYPLGVVTARAAHPEKFGVVHLAPGGYVAAIEEKPEHPTSNLVLTSAYVLTRDIFRFPPERNPANGEYYLSTALSNMAQKHPVKAVEANFWFPIGTPDDLAHAEHTSFV